MHAVLSVCAVLAYFTDVILSSLVTVPNSSLPSTVISVNTTFISSSTSTSTFPSQTSHISSTTFQDVEIIHERRLSTIVAALNLSEVPQISEWLVTLDSSGTWPDVDYTTGCAAQRANWPAEVHWQRLQLMAAAWHGGLQGAVQYVKGQSIRNSISLGMNYWFARDFVNPDCLDAGGTALCPCNNPNNTLWNTNWFSNVILIPNLIGQTCLLLNESLTMPQLNNCTRITGRSYAAFGRARATYLTGANVLDVAKIGIDGALLAVNVTQLTDAFRRVHQQVIIQDGVKADGIRPDGSFGQHSGVLYNGNYGHANDVLDFEVEASGTQFTANSTVRTAFETLFDGNRWMIYRNALTGVNHWDFSVVGRFIAFAVADDQAISSINSNLTEVQALGELWSSSTLIDYAEKLSQNSTNANAGSLIGNRMFYDNDYMVHRGHKYVSTLKMYSTRTDNTECINLANPFGFHLSDGALYTYLVGNEYEDIAAAWDWNLIPGITVDYGATHLNCSSVQATGVETFVGGVSDGSVGLAVMRYTNPLTQSLYWQKAWFFLPDDVQHVMISDITSSSGAPVFTVLDQRLHSGSIYVNGIKRSAADAPSIPGAQNIWHGGVGYVVNDLDYVTLSFKVGQKTGNWSAIGTSAQPPSTVDLFATWLEHDNLDQPVSYTAFPSTSLGEFLSKANQTQLTAVRNDESISAVYYPDNKIAILAFWQPLGGIVTFTPCGNCASVTVQADGNIAVIYRVETGDITVADPSQTLAAVELTFVLSPEGRPPSSWGGGLEKSIIIPLPTGGQAGSSVTRNIC
ncbi:hypothetical protein AX15_004841 [Amanita polypyramis BW_CC]|nr:hypothetical protein AX15_004841 [Amanita polypyramis BW_CC]